ncbi:hypothetical protein [Paenibacillus sp. sgz500958]|uniref:hypothetical protein n=1 Tax=Paenibacillus sp. sgz500958 TaxID=3242475 RepID=UPI0036D2CDBC
MIYAAGFILVLVVALMFILFRNKDSASKAAPAQNRNVVSIDRHRQSKQKTTDQPCSSCRKKNGKLIFYAQDNGSVVGLCKDCRVKAKKRDMLPL